MSKKIKTSPSKVTSETNIPLESEKFHSNTEPPYLKYSQAPSDGFFIGSFFVRMPFAFTIGRKIALPFLIILSLMVVMIGITLKGNNTQINNDHILHEKISKQRTTANLRSSVTSLIMSTNDYVITGKDDYRQKFKLQRIQVEDYQKKLQAFKLSNEELLIVNSIATDLDSIYAYANQIFAIPYPKFSPEAVVLMEIMDYTFADAVNRKTTEIFNIVAHKIEIMIFQSALTRKKMMNLIYSGFFLSFLVSLVVGYLSIQKISKPIKALSKLAESITKGNYTLRPIVLSRDEIGTLTLSFFKMAQTVQESLNKLKESEKKLHVTLESIPDALITTNKQGIILSINKQTESLFGYSAEDLLHQPINLLIPNRFKEKHVKHVENYQRQPKQREMGNGLELVAKRKDGSEFPTEIMLNPFKIRNEDRMLCTVRDITKRKKTENALQQSELELREAQRISGLGSWYLNVANNEVVWSKELYKMYNFDSKLPPPPYTEHQKLFTPESWQKLNSALLKTKETGIPYELELKTLRKDGSNGWIWVRGEQVKDANVVTVGFRGIALDITQRKQKEKELLSAKEKAEESDRLKSAFLANMSHEIRTPMNGILGFADLLKSPNLSGEKQQKYIRVIEKSGTRMLNIINDIVSISKIESGLMEVNLEESNINEQIEYIYTFFKPEAETKGITLSLINTLPLKEAIVKTDREKVYAILTNLVKNAIKYSERGSIELGYTKKGKHLEFYVKDMGIGIDNDRQEAIFERFIQADISDKEAFQGAGLGLSISKAYVEMLGGKLWVESEKGKGSIFYFTIPYDVETKGENESIIDNTDRELETPLKKLNILIVEDDETSSWLLGEMLGNLGKKVLYATNGLEAVEICRNNTDIDLILMDMRMPVMDGYEATRQIRQFNKKSFIIAQTAFAFEGDREKAINAGCNEHLSKPIAQNILFSLIKEHFVN